MTSVNALSCVRRHDVILSQFDNSQGHQQEAMHTDEYEISLSRELDVCKKTIGKLQKSLRTMEKKYHITSETFVESYPSERFPVQDQDFIDWIGDYEALRKWEERKREFEEIFHRMKI